MSTSASENYSGSRPQWKNRLRRRRPGQNDTFNIFDFMFDSDASDPCSSSASSSASAPAPASPRDSRPRSRQATRRLTQYDGGRLAGAVVFFFFFCRRVAGGWSRGVVRTCKLLCRAGCVSPLYLLRLHERNGITLARCGVRFRWSCFAPVLPSFARLFPATVSCAPVAIRVAIRLIVYRFPPPPFSLWVDHHLCATIAADRRAAPPTCRCFVLCRSNANLLFTLPAPSQTRTCEALQRARVQHAADVWHDRDRGTVLLCASPQGRQGRGQQDLSGGGVPETPVVCPARPGGAAMQNPLNTRRH